MLNFPNPGFLRHKPGATSQLFKILVKQNKKGMNNHNGCILFNLTNQFNNEE